jgi:hypothetical protein
MSIGVRQPFTVAYTHSVFANLFLPRSKVEGITKTSVGGTGALLTVDAGMLQGADGKMIRQIVPYGAMARMLLAWISTAAIQADSPHISICDSAMNFLRSLGVEPTGRRYAVLHEQLNALAACDITLKIGDTNFNLKPVTQFDYWPENNTKSRTIWPGRMVLHPEYFASLREQQVELDYQALIQLNGSSFAIDIYTWLADLLPKIEDTVDAPWQALRTHFGAEYGDYRDFRKAFLHALPQVKRVYPQASTEVTRTGLVLKPSLAPDASKRFSAPRRAVAKSGRLPTRAQA